MTQRPLHLDDNVTAVGHLDLSDPRRTLFALPPHSVPHEADINRNYPSIVLDDPRDALAPFTHGEILSVRGLWGKTALQVKHADTAERPAERSTSLRGLIHANEPSNGWLLTTETQDERVEVQVQELFDDGTILRRTDIPVRTAENLPTICTYVLATNPVRAQEILEPLFKHSLLVRPSAYTKPQVSRTHNELAGSPFSFYAAGESLGPTGDIQINIFVPYLTPDLLEWAESTPSGLVSITPWLKHASEPLTPTPR
ncbi:hypothetical protein FBY31_4632 [Arthrobacter sp. SLBN-100]|uniref:hypothetical protein n=1 Tax=Arthrobacter sp. SLBN-100 TaxID=2768450 RepID=UPI0011541A26|nr:hypothetical protein [Arthrobacter sp. SLBN-100]TQJ62229.1 hypothetical protein FBY31_4632 [Arthrobacter sp. SLBN-100]